MIENNDENTAVKITVPYLAFGWIGLYRVPWTWADNSNSLFRNWQIGEPNNGGGTQHCVTENAQHKWDDNFCWKELPFICHEDHPPLKLNSTVVRMLMQTAADLADAATNTQILQQLGAALQSHGGSDIKLRWRIQPTKQEKKKPKESHCN
ncbi:perlucin-like [Plectropomus leopardus]|uniref:perlucin-like n=1 Tax=Plectropomus leopardus TaxID=160734 RepID=UPI001C4CF7EC|nr:perlucin-like [Plectropomus leopardus]